MTSTTPAAAAVRPTGQAAPGVLAWACALVSILASCLALALTIHRVAATGEFQAVLSHQTLTPFITIAYAVIGALVASRRPRNPIGWIFAVVGLLSALTPLATALRDNGPASFPILAWSAWFQSWLWVPAVILPVTYVLLIFPDGRYPSPRWRVIGLAAGTGLVITSLDMMLQPANLGVLRFDPILARLAAVRPVLNFLSPIGGILLGIGVVGSLAACFLRLRRSTGIQHEQMKWLAYSVGLALLSGIVSTVVSVIWPDSPVVLEISITLTNLSVLGIGVATAAAILRYRLYDINFIINRTLVYAALTVGVAVLYGLVVGALSLLLQARSNLFVSLLGTGTAAIVMQPMRDRLQRFVNRLMYGERDDPFAVLSRLNRRLEGALPPEAALPVVVETIAQALKLPYVAVALNRAGNLHIAASYGTNGNDSIHLPLIYQGETVGQLRFSRRSSNEAFTPYEERLLRDIARHIGVTAHTVLLNQALRQLALDLQRSREELVISREEERRRLRRDLHDELGPQLASLKLNLDVARNLVSRDPGSAEDLLRDLRAQCQSVIADIRQLVYDLRPPALDELGLQGAVQEYTRQLIHQDGLRLQFTCPQNLPTLPAAVEVAAYRITLEALTNVVRHSQGKNCTVALSVRDRHLQVEVCDDGLGIPNDFQPGVGLNSMRERAAELGGTCTFEPLPGGGTRVLARLPV